MGLPNAYKTTITNSLLKGGSETEIAIATIQTLDGQTISISDFAKLGNVGYLVIDAQSTDRIEYIKFTGIDSGTPKFTGLTRGLSFLADSSISANKKFHPAGATVFITWSTYEIAQMVDKSTDESLDGVKTFIKIPVLPSSNPTLDNQAARKKYVDETLVGLVGTASDTQFGTVKTSVAPALPGAPIAVGDNDPRMPTQGEKDALEGSAGTPSSTNRYLTEDEVVAVTKGGDGSDGPLTIASGVTTIDLLGAALVIKNFTSVSITGTGKLAFSNPNANGTSVIFKVKGNWTVTSSNDPAIDLQGLGGIAGTGGAEKTGSTQTGNSGGDGNDIYDGTFLDLGREDDAVHKGGGASGGVSGSAGLPGQGADGTLGAKFARTLGSLIPRIASNLYRVALLIAPGAGGAGGASGGRGPGGGGGNSGKGGDGGRGSGSLLAIISGSYTCSGIIDLNAGAGGDGDPGVASSANSESGGGSGGGGGASALFAAFFRTLVSDTGTYRTSGGIGGDGGNGDVEIGGTPAPTEHASGGGAPGGGGSFADSGSGGAAADGSTGTTDTVNNSSASGGKGGKGGSNGVAIRETLDKLV